MCLVIGSNVYGNRIMDVEKGYTGRSNKRRIMNGWYPSRKLSAALPINIGGNILGIYAAR